MAEITKIELTFSDGKKVMMNSLDLPGPLVRKVRKYSEKFITATKRITEPYFDEHRRSNV